MFQDPVSTEGCSRINKNKGVLCKRAGRGVAGCSAHKRCLLETCVKKVFYGPDGATYSYVYKMLANKIVGRQLRREWNRALPIKS